MEGWRKMGEWSEQLSHCWDIQSIHRKKEIVLPTSISCFSASSVYRHPGCIWKAVWVKGKPACSWTWTAWHSGEGPSTKVMDVYLYRGVGVSESISCRGWRCLCFLILPGVLLCQNSTSSGACMYLAAWNVQRSTGSTQNHMTGHLQARSLTNHISSHTKPARAVNT